jgi:hypothetical protein
MSVLAKPPPPSKGVRWADYHHSLLLFDVKEVEEGVKTAYGEADAVRADLNVVDGAGKGDAVPDTLVFPKVLAGQLRRRVGQQTYGRLGQGNAKPSQSPPWVLDDPSDADTALVEQWLGMGQPTLPSVDSGDDKAPY